MIVVAQKTCSLSFLVGIGVNCLVGKQILLFFTFHLHLQCPGCFFTWAHLVVLQESPAQSRMDGQPQAIPVGLDAMSGQVNESVRCQPE